MNSEAFFIQKNMNADISRPYSCELIKVFWKFHLYFRDTSIINLWIWGLLGGKSLKRDKKIKYCISILGNLKLFQILNKVFCY